MVENKKDYFKEFKKRVEAILKCNTSALNKYFWIKLSDKNFHEKVVKKQEKQEKKGVHADAVVDLHKSIRHMVICLKYD